MVRFVLQPKQFPVETVDYNEPPDIYEENKVAIWVFFGLFTLLCFVTLFLLFTVVRKRRAEKSLLVLKNELEQRVVKRTTELSSANAEITEREQRMQSLLSNLSSMIYRYRYYEKWLLVSVNEGSVALIGYSEKELLEKREVQYSDMIDEKDRQMVTDRINKAVSEKMQFEIEYQIKTKDKQI